MNNNDSIAIFTIIVLILRIISSIHQMTYKIFSDLSYILHINIMQIIFEWHIRFFLDLCLHNIINSKKIHCCIFSTTFLNFTFLN